MAKSPDAAISQQQSQTVLSQLNQCPSFASFERETHPALQRNCISCHQSGGSGSQNFTLVSGADSTAVVNNFLKSWKHLYSDSTRTLSDLDGTVLLLQKLNGALSHPITLGFTQEYLMIRGFVQSELNSSCSINFESGVVEPAPSVSPEEENDLARAGFETQDNRARSR